MQQVVPARVALQPVDRRVIQDPIGAYVEAPTETRFAAATNYIGYSSNRAYKTNVLAQGSIVCHRRPAA